ncbi:MAG: hypothetical protein ABI723_11900 [Bacteroidia bacterium]
MKLIKILIILTIGLLVILLLLKFFGSRGEAVQANRTFDPPPTTEPAEKGKDSSYIDVSLKIKKNIAIMNTYLDSIPFGKYSSINDALNLLNKNGVEVMDTSQQSLGTLNEFILRKDLSSFDVYNLNCSSSDCNIISNVYIVKNDLISVSSPCSNENDNKKIITDKVVQLQGYVERIVAARNDNDKNEIIEQAINLFADTSFYIEIILDRATQTKKTFKIKDYFNWLKEKSNLGRFAITWAEEIVLSNIFKDDSSGLYRGEASIKQYWTKIKKVGPEYIPEEDHTHVTNKRVVFFLKPVQTTNGEGGCEVFLGNVYADQIE